MRLAQFTIRKLKLVCLVGRTSRPLVMVRSRPILIRRPKRRGEARAILRTASALDVRTVLSSLVPISWRELSRKLPVSGTTCV